MRIELTALASLLLQAPVLGQGIDNGDFERGNAGFRTTYLYSPASGSLEGAYTVATSVLGWHSLLAVCGDHTSGTGQMMLVNGSRLGATDLVWAQTVAVQPQTAYTFSLWAASEYHVDPADLRVFFNGAEHLRGLQLTSATCTWSNLAVEWWSGTETEVSIVIVDDNPEHFGNDFALDDLSFAASPGQAYCLPAVPNSTGRDGVCMVGGSLAAADGAMRLTAAQLPQDVAGVFLMSPSQDFVPGYTGSVGDLCLGSPFAILSSQLGRSGTTGSISIDVDMTSLPHPFSGAVQPGETWHFQLWHRDAAESNFTGAIAATFQ